MQCDCELTAVEDRRLCFTARVYDDVTEVATATHERYIVDNERFTRKANSKRWRSRNPSVRCRGRPL